MYGVYSAFLEFLNGATCLIPDCCRDQRSQATDIVVILATANEVGFIFKWLTMEN